MPAGGGDLERALGALLALDVAQVEQVAFGLAHLRLRPRQHLRALEVIGDLDQRVGRDDLDVRAGPGRLGAAGRRADQALLARIGADRRRQHAGDRRDRAVEPEFAEHGEAGQRIRRNGADRGHQAERDRQIVMAAFLGQVGGRQIDGDAPRRQREARGDQRRAHPLARLGHRLVRQADDGEGRQPGATCTCTSTARASIPSNATVETRWTMPPPLAAIQASEGAKGSRTLRNMIRQRHDRPAAE